KEPAARWASCTGFVTALVAVKRSPPRRKLLVAVAVAATAVTVVSVSAIRPGDRAPLASPTSFEARPMEETPNTESIPTRFDAPSAPEQPAEPRATTPPRLGPSHPRPAPSVSAPLATAAPKTSARPARDPLSEQK